jgi:hypothetical protein
MTETYRSFDTPSRQAAEDRSVIDHLIKTFHDDPVPAQKPLRADQVSARIRRQWTPESRAMLEMLYSS